MKSIVTQCIHIVLALFILAAAGTPTCAGTENCSMPCCRHKAKSASHPPAAAPLKACCTQTAGASSDIGSGCRFDPHDLALNSEARTASAPAAEVFADSTWTAAHGHAGPTQRLAEHSEPFRAPLYLRIQILLI